ncbi:hypothetical protein MYAM1_000026 [Malassezia yamatoensis]|uniref:Uncharacterized protein n=1 Tax=Malassezia yamatoensis TaxID=253288 RepID=A0AAJ6CH12_9BASI|nr:hypothetical protein MYAM1_000026 [Malassezia yamatoensis]
MVTNEETTLQEYYGLVEKRSEAPSVAKVSAAEWAKTQSLESLIKHSIELMEGIKDLKADHQSLVYNHHQELVTASESIGKMRVGLSELQRRRDKLKDQVSAIDAQKETVASQSSTNHEQVDWDRAVAPVLTLPARLRNEAQVSKSSARQLYEEHKKTIEEWIDAGVDGARQIQTECETVLSS